MRHLCGFLFHRQLPPRTVVLHRLRRRLACPCAPPAGQVPAQRGPVPAGQQPQGPIVPPAAAGVPSPGPALLAGEPARVVLRRIGRRRTDQRPAPLDRTAEPARLTAAGSVRFTTSLTAGALADILVAAGRKLRVAGLVSGQRRMRGAHGTQRAVADQGTAVQGSGETGQVTGGGPDVARGYPAPIPVLAGPWASSVSTDPSLVTSTDPDSPCIGCISRS
jgi:hypothetical protein